jgi:cobalt-zinc-cadmium efflux system protein
VKGLESVHHVHVWSITQSRRMVTLHACIGTKSQPDRLIKDIKARLKSAFGLDHATIEIECGECADEPQRRAKA